MLSSRIEFIQSQQLPWVSHPTAKEIDYKILNQPESALGCTKLYQVKAGWDYRRTFTLNCDEQLYVLSGEVWINDVLHHEGCYAYLPRYFIRHHVYCSQDALVLRILSGDSKPVITLSKPNADTPAQLGKNVFSSSWDDTSVEEIADYLGASCKLLHVDPRTKLKTLLCSVKAKRPSKSLLNKSQCQQPYPVPIAEEIFVLRGSLATAYGNLESGAHCGCLPMISAQEFSSDTGCIYLMRYVDCEYHSSNSVEDVARHSARTDEKPEKV